MSLVIISEGKREVVKPTPTQSLSAILQRVCEKWKIQPSNYALCDAKGKELDLSLSYRLSGLASGAKLELRRRAATKAKNTNVLVGLQMPEGGRVQANFAANTRLWEVLLHFEQQSEGKIVLTKRLVADKYQQPAVTYLQRELSTIAELYRNTLQDLGLDGNGLLRLNFRPTEKSLEDAQTELAAAQEAERQREEQAKKLEEEKARRKAEEEEKAKLLRAEAEKQREKEKEEILRMAKEALAEEEEKRKQEIERMVAEKEKEMEETFREMERAALEQTQAEHLRAIMKSHFAQPPPASSETSTSTSTSPSTTKPLDSMDVEQKPLSASKTRTRIEIPDRELRVLPPSDRPFDPREFEVPESFFEVTEEDYKAALMSIKASKMRMEEESAMRTKDMREKDRLRKIPKYKKTLIKVRFPNRVELQATFHPAEKAQSVHNVVKDALADSERPFYLFTTPPRQRLDLTKSLFSLLMVPAAIVYFSWEDNSGPVSDYFKEELVRDIADQIPAPVSFPQSQASTPAGGGGALMNAFGHMLGFSSSSSSSSSSTSQGQPRDAESDERPAVRQRTNEGRDYSNAVPKWFTSGKRK